MSGTSRLGITGQMEPDSTVYKTLLESTNAIPWKIDWATKQFAYIGPQVERLLGWPQASWVSLDDWAERMYDDDRDRVVNYCTYQSRNGVDHEADYRALCRDGSYIWIRDVVHVLRDGDHIEALVGFMFDIDQRKRNEQELQRLRDELEALSYQDGLTGIANRRQLDSVLAREWGMAVARASHLSILLADIDFFKQYNDEKGHLAGDQRLKDIARLLQEHVRPRDLVARYGGEEFVLVLPDTDNHTACKIADRCQQAVRDARIPHETSADGSWLSISIGVATAQPDKEQQLDDFLNAVDAAIYRAKQQGRNRVEA